ncbi:MAG: diacylglycerol kinase family protein [Verrucomicrobiota bacterium]
MRRCVIFNPAARGERARQFRNQLGLVGAECALRQTATPGDARRLATNAVLEGFTTIIAAGGDGTVNEVLNGIADAPGGLDRARLGLLPLGTINVFARELKIPRSFDGAWQTLLAGHETRVDLPWVEFSGPHGPEKRCFAQLAGAGLDAHAIELVSWNLKKLIGPGAYVAAGFHAMFRPPFNITAQSGSRRETGQLALVGNGRLYGGSFNCFPNASPHDGQLDLCLFPRAGWITLLRCAASLLLRRRLPPGALREIQCDSFTLNSHPPAPLEIDGEWIGRLPATFTVQPAALRVVTP